jgi:putative transposase
VTAIATGGGWLYLAPMLDLHSRRAGAWAASDSNDTEFALSCERQSGHVGQLPDFFITRIEAAKYASDDYRAELRLHPCTVLRSMSRKGDRSADLCVPESKLASC